VRLFKLLPLPLLLLLLQRRRRRQQVSGGRGEHGFFCGCGPMMMRQLVFLLTHLGFTPKSEPKDDTDFALGTPKSMDAAELVKSFSNTEHCLSKSVLNKG